MHELHGAKTYLAVTILIKYVKYARGEQAAEAQEFKELLELLLRCCAITSCLVSEASLETHDLVRGEDG